MNITINATFWAGVQALGLLITLALIYLQIRIQTRQTQIQTKQFEIQTASHIVQTLHVIDERWTSQAMLQARKHVCDTYLNNEFVMDGLAHLIAEYIEKLGVYLEIEAVPKPVMWETYSWYIEHYYRIFTDGIQELRRTYHDDALYRKTEFLFKAMRSIEEENGFAKAGEGIEDLKRFAQEESESIRVILGLSHLGSVGSGSDQGKHLYS